MKQRFDELDKKILFELDINARQPIKTIAKKVHASPEVVAYRIKRLEQEQILRGYYTIIDFAKLGYWLGRIYLKLQKTDQKKEEEIIHFLLQQPNIFTLYETEGSWDLALGYLIKNTTMFGAIIEQIKSNFKPYIKKITTALFLSYIHYPRTYLIGNKNHDFQAIMIGGDPQKQINKEDMQLLHAIAENARIKLSVLSKDLGKTTMGIYYHLKRLEHQKVILGYRAMIDYQKIGRFHYKMDFWLEDTTIKKALHSFAQQHPAILYEDYTIGGSDFECDAELPDHEAYYHLIQTIKNLFPGKIREITYYRARKAHLYRYLIKEEQIEKQKTKKFK